MPAMLEDPASPTIHRRSGEAPFPDPNNPQLPVDISPRQVTLRDRQTVATIVPYASAQNVPPTLLAYLCDQFNKEIEGGDTYPMVDTFTVEGFTQYWFQNMAAIMLLGSLDSADEVVEGKDWSKECLGSFYIKPNYPGRSSHICNAGFLVTDASRNRGVGRLMGETYIIYAPRLGYTYSVFNLVYETNVVSCRIWDALGFKRIGRVKECGNLKSYPDRLIDAIIYGRDLNPDESEDLVSEERFDKIKYYLKFNKYPAGADRAEKSRLRSAATHYKLLEGDKLMLKDKEVISDPLRQYAIAREVHVQNHGGINKTTATIAEKYHWSRIKETVSDVIRGCRECKELGKTTNSLKRGAAASISAPNSTGSPPQGRAGEPARPTRDTMDVLAFQDGSRAMMLPTLSQDSSGSSPATASYEADLASIQPSHTLHGVGAGHDLHGQHHLLPPHQQHQYQPIDPQMIDQPGSDVNFDQYRDDSHVADFQALLDATEDTSTDNDTAADAEAAAAAVDRDLDMLIEHDADGDGAADTKRNEKDETGLYDWDAR
ncbi:uncharacterized protein F5Z01DRAFT_665878 [Emericellopsis atlantica]|uniref:Zinc finger H2C2-type histone UAS binding domain-containing protein n=1 Tax=Emericellopsis atlantica TaxID=2614577 RepID=A0A9P7ZEA3_9HYPO|nr:uncharacterized protein F5Z01DRAFT_665878 [Emericellopsis atlantica]KAG9250553.1 hypothetical protein F5Z01DRAFT_665878 [Emericellopsis atlantica]